MPTASKEQYFRTKARKLGFSASKDRETGQWTFTKCLPKGAKSSNPPDDITLPEPKGEYTFEAGHAFMKERNRICNIILRRNLNGKRRVIIP